MLLLNLTLKCTVLFRRGSGRRANAYLKTVQKLYSHCNQKADWDLPVFPLVLGAARMLCPSWGYMELCSRGDGYLWLKSDEPCTLASRARCWGQPRFDAPLRGLVLLSRLECLLNFYLSSLEWMLYWRWLTSVGEELASPFENPIFHRQVYKAALFFSVAIQRMEDY